MKLRKKYWYNMLCVVKKGGYLKWFRSWLARQSWRLRSSRQGWIVHNYNQEI